MGIRNFFVLFILISVEGISLTNKEQKKDVVRESDDAEHNLFNVWKEAMIYNPEGKKLYDMFNIEELVQCFKKHGFDPSNLPNIEDVSNVGKEVIFNSCNPLFNVPIIALQYKSNNIQHQHKDQLEKEKRSISRSSRHTIGTKQDKYAAGNQGSAARPFEVLVTFDQIDIISEIVRLQFLFLSTFFSSISGCIESEDIDLSVCLLEAFSNAFSLLTIELGKN